MAFADSPQSLFVCWDVWGIVYADRDSIARCGCEICHLARYLARAGIHLCCQGQIIDGSIVRNEQKLSGAGP